jgi:hypothetical protein
MEVSEYILGLMEFNDGLLKGKTLTDCLGKFHGNVTIKFQAGEVSVYGYGRTVKEEGDNVIKVG